MMIRFFFWSREAGSVIVELHVGHKALWAQRPIITAGLGLLIRRRSVDLEKSDRLE
jgi:hypothetical protein